MNDEPKENKCEILFDCKGFNLSGSECAYFTRNGNNCEYAVRTDTGFRCNSVVAQINRMVLLLQDAGFDVSRKGNGDNE